MSNIIKQSKTTGKHQRYSCTNKKIQRYDLPKTTIVTDSETNPNPEIEWSGTVSEEVVLEQKELEDVQEVNKINEVKEVNEEVEVKKVKEEVSDKASRRRQIDPTTCERDYTTAEIEFMNALDSYKRTSGRMFPTCSEILEVFLSLGYVKRDTLEQEGPEKQETVSGHNPATPAFAMEGEYSTSMKRSLFSPYHDDQSTFLNF